MVLYKNGNHFQQSNHNAFDIERTPGSVPVDSGIYRCVHCGDEIAANKGQPLPPQNHHQHTTSSPIRWKLIACAQQR